MSGKCEARIDMSGDFLRKIGNAAKQGLKDCLKTTILPIAKANSPKRTGENAKSIAARVKSRPSMVSASIYTQSGHGGYLEKGTSKMGPTPYIYPAVEQGVAELGGFIRTRIEEFAAGLDQDIPNELIGEAMTRLKTSKDKGVGIIGGAEARKKKAAKRGMFL